MICLSIKRDWHVFVRFQITKDKWSQWAIQYISASSCIYLINLLQVTLTESCGSRKRWWEKGWWLENMFKLPGPFFPEDFTHTVVSLLSKGHAMLVVMWIPKHDRSLVCLELWLSVTQGIRRNSQLLASPSASLALLGLWRFSLYERKCGTNCL